MQVLDNPTIARAELMRRWHAGGEENGRFLIGVVSTGIYCLPSCRARKPKDENVRFLLGEAEAQAAGLRACKRCRPDHFYRNFDPDAEGLFALVERLRADPSAFGHTRDLCAAMGVGSTKLAQLFRQHYHQTPAIFLQQARLVAAARALLRSKASVVEVGLAVGFDSASGFHESFLRRFGLAPGAYRKLRGASGMRLSLPDDFRSHDLFGLFGRDPDGRTEKLLGQGRAIKALRLAGKPARLELRFQKSGLAVQWDAPRKLPVGAGVEAHQRVLRLLGLAHDPGPFERRLARSKGLGRLIRGRRGLRIPQTNDAYEALVWVIVGQQVNLEFASVCRARLIELCGTDAGQGALAHPTPEQVAVLDYADLTRLQFSGRKAEYLIDTSRAIASGELDLEGLALRSVGTIEKTLGAVRGLGPWSINYLMMRAFGLGDCVPVGDSGLVAALKTFFDLEARPDAPETLRLMEVFAPHRSLASFHLWKSLDE